MTDFLIYDAKVAVLIAVFYMFYRLLLSRETFHRVNRIVLLTTAVASFVLPLCVITLHETVTMAMPELDLEVGAVVAEAPAVPLWQTALPILFIIGMCATLGHTLLSMIRIILLIRRSEQHPQSDGVTICVTGNAALSPFSWMHYIVMNRADYEDHDSAILTHERGHIRLRHSWDVLLVDVLTALQWFNPAMWMLRTDLRAIHEYEADAAVLSQGINARQYQYLLITKAAGIGGYYLANGISHSTLKNRINMMLHKKSRSSHLLKLLALVPIVGITLVMNAETVVDVAYTQPQKQITKKGQKAGIIKVAGQEIKVEEAAPAQPEPLETSAATKEVTGQDEAYDVVDEMPQFPGGIAAFMEYLMQNIRYPEDALEVCTQGRVIVQFVVGKDGSISDAHVVKGVYPSLDEEALRVINAMPRWTPGKQMGETVAVKYTVPVTFMQKGEKGDPAEVTE